ncbi:splicing factor 3B subunit 4-like [Dorcoceras hygrometricum]|uniref:Splicing factor 3B subunit 4-like n=1 Tax=Dorcoceras hygrometricum TaxID=472368 RepID=A0A2Z7D180_9LAMI|nr:splicing factor 3B subunit 4-like [Dorcoceras hygrometricum]
MVNLSACPGNIDDRVSERVLYDILIQAGRVVDLHIPRDKETGKPKGFAFAEYESEEIAEYAVKLFSGLVTLYRRTLKFGMSGQDKPSVSLQIPTSPTVNSSFKPRPHSLPDNHGEFSPQAIPTSRHFSEHKSNHSRAPLDVSGRHSHPIMYNDGIDHGRSRRLYGSALDNVGRSRSGRHDARDSVNYYSSR